MTDDAKITHHPSPNCDERPLNTAVDTIVLHATVLDTLQEVIAHFSSTQTRVSSHYTIDRDGRVVSHVPEVARAWHAGVSRMQDGRTGVNDFSIGIELVNRNDGTDPFPRPQIQAMRDLVRTIIARHPIRHIIPHYACAEPPGRKSDPVGFESSWIEDLLPTRDTPGADPK
jgi:N-acetylmuramoyl-L-alanine amidase